MEHKASINHENHNYLKSILEACKIVVLQGRIAHVEGNKEDLIVRFNSTINVDNIIKAVNNGHGNIREATLKEKEYWFLCYDNSNNDFLACFMSDYNKWLSTN